MYETINVRLRDTHWKTLYEDIKYSPEANRTFIRRERILCECMKGGAALLGITGGDTKPIGQGFWCKGVKHGKS